MFNEKQCEALFLMAKQHAEATPAIGSRLACNCDTVSFGMLGIARDFVPPEIKLEIQLNIGWITIDGKEVYHFTENDWKSWRRDNRPKKFPGHAWLSFGNEILDLTLPSTLLIGDLLDSRRKEKLQSFTYMTKKIAADLGIEYFPVVKGDDVLNVFLGR
ncbi:hypothetical protein [Methylovorus mays]|uniref:hypothetical protein n=1 Tax=Methylovorus mays TaxID=184077 RepID=UPI001E428327|nr:hypothetical protein [Methylovorus mays]MCB5207720.1 hypothetical protein [Methylovorus mays]